MPAPDGMPATVLATATFKSANGYRTVGGARLEVAGHTDSVGDASVNMKLSQRRSDAVRKYLVQSGVSPDKIVARGYGETQPIADNTSDEGRDTNRRIEFRVLGSDG